MTAPMLDDDEDFYNEDIAPPPGATVLDERRIVAGDRGHARHGAISLDPIEIEGERSFTDSAADVADSVLRKGAPARGVGDLLTDAPSVLARGYVQGLRGARDSVNETTSDLARYLDENNAVTGTINRLGDVPAVGDSLSEWLDSGTSGAEGVAQGATFGFGDEIAGAGAAGLAALAGEDAGAAYEGTRDARREDFRRARLGSPSMTALGEAAGAAPAAIGIAMPATGAGALGAIGTGMAEGLGFGALNGLGSSEAEDLDGMLSDTVEGGLYGGALGAAGAGVGQGVGAGIRGMRRLAGNADELRVAAGLGTGNSPLSVKGQQDVEALPGGVRGAADFLRQHTPRLGTVGDAAAGLERATDESMGELDAFGQELDAVMPTVPVERFERSLESVAEELATDPGAPGLASRPRTVANEWRDAAAASAALRARRAANPPPSAAMVPPATDRTARRSSVEASATLDPEHILGERARRGMRTMRSRVNHVSANEGVPAAAAELETLRALRRTYDDAAEEALGPGTADRYRELRNRHAIGSTLELYSRPAAMRAARSAGPGLRATMMGAGAAASGDPTAVAMATAEGHGFLNRRRPALNATAAESVRWLLENTPRALGEYADVLGRAMRRGGEAFAGRHAALMRTDADYRAMVEAATAEDAMGTEFDDDFEAAAAEEATATPPTDEEFDAEFEAAAAAGR